MAQASDYPISFPYGATSAPYSVDHPHRGDDRACPSGTPIIIGGVTIGLTGATGKVTGPHLHIQEWQGNVVTGIRKPQNAFKPGVVVNIDPNGTQGDGSFGKFITIKTADGWNDSYCHLSSINVTVGQVLQGDTMEPTFNEGDAQNCNMWFYGVELGLHRDQIGKKYKDAIGSICTGKEFNFESRINDGDVSNLKAAGISNPELAKGRVWKDGVYQVVLKNLPSGGNAPAGTYLKVDSQSIMTIS